MGTFDQVSYKMPLQDGLETYSKIQENVLKDLEKRGIYMPNAPTYQTEAGPTLYQGEVPTDLPELDNKQLGKLLGLLSAWIDYLSAQVSLANMARNVAKEQLELTEAVVRLTYKEDENGKKRIVQERDALVKDDPRFIQANAAYMYMDSHHDILDVRLSSARQNYKAVSRQISMVIADNERGTRDENVRQFTSPSVIAPGRGRGL